MERGSELSPNERRVVVVGGGILGASIAYHVARRGGQVTLLERSRPAAEASGRSFGWINATFGNPQPYFGLRLQSMLEHRRLEYELDGALQVMWGGSLLWLREGQQENLARLVRNHQDCGYDVRLVEASEFQTLEPAVDPVPPLAAYAALEGGVDAAHATAVLLDRATRLGAHVVVPCAVTGLELTGLGPWEVETTGGRIEADVVVVAAGVSTPDLVRAHGVTIPLVESPSVIAHTKPSNPRLGRLLLTPDFHMKQDRDGRFVLGSGFSQPTSSDGSKAHGERLLTAARRFLPELASIELERVTVGWRPMPRDERPIIGFCPPASGLYVAVTHSGVTLAPLLGRLAAMEIVDGVSVQQLEPYRPSRFD